MPFLLILLVTLALAYANGANDNFKGVATLFGSGTTNYRAALLWATVTTFLGSGLAVLIAGRLLQAFSGKGLVPAGTAATLEYAAAVAFAAAATVLLATRIGMPISTTHALVGGLVGAAWASGAPLDVGRLGTKFFLPLLVSPILAIAATVVVYSLFHRMRRGLGITAETCLCIGSEPVEIVPGPLNAAVMAQSEQLTASTGDVVTCHEQYGGQFVGLPAATVLDRLHFFSSGIVCFARGLNDTPKIAAMLLLVPAIGGVSGLLVVGTAMAIGGLVSARRVAETTSHGITSMNHGQGFSANLVTGAVVIGASQFGLPVSTTHVSCGSLFGLGAVTGRSHGVTIGHIVLAWLATLPLGALLGWCAYNVLAQVV